MTTYEHIGENKIRTLTLMAFYPLIMLIAGWGLCYFFMKALYDYAISSPKLAAFLHKYGYTSILWEILNQPFDVLIQHGYNYVLIGVFVFCAVMFIISYFFGDVLLLTFCGHNAVEATPKSHKQLYSTVKAMSITSGLPMPLVFVMPDHNANAFSLGRNPKHASIVVTEGLLQILNKSELEAVIAHEMAHIGNRDVLVMTVAVTFIYGIVLLAALLPFARLRFARGFWGLIISLILVVYGFIISPLVRVALSRRREFLADSTAALLTRNPGALASAIKKIEDRGSHIPTLKGEPLVAGMCLMPADERDNSDYFSYVFGWFDSHPQTIDRLNALKDMEGRFVYKT